MANVNNCLSQWSIPQHKVPHCVDFLWSQLTFLVISWISLGLTSSLSRMSGKNFRSLQQMLHLLFLWVVLPPASKLGHRCFLNSSDELKNFLWLVAFDSWKPLQFLDYPNGDCSLASIPILQHTKDVVCCVISCQAKIS